MSLKDYAVMPYSDYEGACEAIREKDGSSAPIKSGELRSKILGIETGADVSVVTATAPDVLTPKVIVGTDGIPITGTMPDNGPGGGTISSVSRKITIPKGYYNGQGSVTISSAEKAKIIESNIAEGVTLLGITGTYNGKFAWGTNAWMGDGVNTYTLSGLPFKPKIVTYSTPAYSFENKAVFASLMVDTTIGEKKLWYFRNGSSATAITAADYAFDWGITNDGFFLQAKDSSSRVWRGWSGTLSYWVAIG